MRIGLIARCEMARGLAIQARNFYEHMPVDSVLCVRMPRPDAPENPDWYRDRTDATYNPKNHTLDERIVRRWLKDLDVVFCVETPHDWRIPGWCREQGVRLVVQGNPEFVRHMREEGNALGHPDQWWWPTSWRLDHLPPGIVMPVPMDVRPRRRTNDPRLHVLHVIGKRAFADRNGTEILVQAMRMVQSKIKLTICSIDGDIIPFPRRPNVEYWLRPQASIEQWSLYADQDLLVLPRRYGGLSLPALEAAASGMVVAMTDCSPNWELATVMIPVQRQTSITMACGVVRGFDANAGGVAAIIDMMTGMSSDEFDAVRAGQLRLLPTWDEYRDRYLKAFEALL